MRANRPKVEIGRGPSTTPGRVSILGLLAGSLALAIFLWSSPVEAPTQPEVATRLGVNAPPASAQGVVKPPRAADQAGNAGRGFGNRLNILLLGTDGREYEEGLPARSDSIIVVSVDPTRKTAAMISIPRDMWVEIPGFANNRINAANAVGDANGYPGGGPALARETVEHNFGLHIDYYARIDFTGFKRLVDDLGGVTVDVERPIVDEQYRIEGSDVRGIHIPAGVQRMNGEIALQYARSRYGDSDFGRARRQQVLLMAIRDRAMQIDAIPRLPFLIGALFNMVETDIPPQELLRLARLANEVDPANVTTLVIDQRFVTPFKGENGADLLMPKKAEIDRAIAEAMGEGQ